MAAHQMTHCSHSNLACVIVSILLALPVTVYVSCAYDCPSGTPVTPHLYHYCTQVMSIPANGLLQQIGGTTVPVQVNAFSQIELLHVSRPASCLFQQAYVSRLLSAGLCQQAYVSTFVVRQQLSEQLRELFENCLVPTDIPQMYKCEHMV